MKRKSTSTAKLKAWLCVPQAEAEQVLKHSLRHVLKPSLTNRSRVSLRLRLRLRLRRDLGNSMDLNHIPEGEVIRESSTARSRDFYLAYFNSPDWRRKRNAALQRAGYRCNRCGSKRDLQAHHLTYDRLGAELDSDLEVLCLICHEGETIEQTSQSPQGIYLKLASEVLRSHFSGDIGELSERVKLACADHHIPYDGPAIHRALELLTGTRFKPSDPKKRAPEYVADPIGVSAAEAHEILARLQIVDVPAALLKSMPEVEKTPREQQAHEKRVENQALEIRRSLTKPKRRPMRERLEAIFAGDGL